MARDVVYAPVMDFAVLIYEGVDAVEVASLERAMAQLAALGLGTPLFVGATEVIEDVTLSDGRVITPGARLRNRPPLDLLLMPGYSEDKEVLSLLQAREPMDEHVLAFGRGVLMMAEAGLLKHHATSAPLAEHEKLAALGVTRHPQPFHVTDTLTTVAEENFLPAALAGWLKGLGRNDAAEKLLRG